METDKIVLDLNRKQVSFMSILEGEELPDKMLLIPRVR